MKNQKFLDRVMQIANAVGSNKYMSAVSSGLMGTLPLLMIGSLALLLAVLPIEPYKQFITDIGLQAALKTVSTLTTSLIALYASFTIAYRLAEKLELSAMIPGLLGVLCFLVITPMASATTDAGATVTFLDPNWMGAKGLFAAILAALLSCRLYAFFVAKKLTIKMPESVETIVASSFASLIPAIITTFLFMTVAYLFTFTSWGSVTECIYTFVALPLTKLTDSIWSLVILVFIQQILWFFGISGSLVIMPFIASLYLPLDMANMEAVAAGVANSELPNIVGKAFYNCFAGIGGTGGTLSLCILLVLLSRSKKNKMIGGMTIVPGFFAINEPVVFGYPIVLNPIMAIPFVAVPLVQILIAYAAIASGLFPRMIGTQVSFGFPVGVSGFLCGGWQIALLQLLLVAVGVLIYYPFFKISDQMALKEERASEGEEV